jgi:DNA-binding NtrC family response regulator
MSNKGDRDRTSEVPPSEVKKRTIEEGPIGSVKADKVDLGANGLTVRDRTEPLPSEVVELLRRGLEQKTRIALILFPGVPVIVGREAPADVRIPDPTLSREHARFTLQGGKITIEDLESTNGTWLSGQSVQSAELKPGDEVILGGLLACVHALGAAESTVGLESHERFLVRLEDEVVRARHFRERFAVLLVRAASPLAHVGRWMPSIRSLLRPVDRMALYSSDAVEILLPDMGDDGALEVARVLSTSRPAGDLPLLVGVATYPGAATAADKLIELSRDAAKIASVERPVQIANTTRWVAGEAFHAPGDEPALSGYPSVIAGPAMREVFETAAKLSASRIPVVLSGETGTGKEVVARVIHDGGPRRGKPMICVNCGAIAQQLVESFFFGHEKGSFTGATQQQRGVFEEADGGTVFLDEIGELPLSAQAALLRVLESRRVTRVGSTKEIPVDVRIIAATHRDLEAMCATAAFREDLYYRLNTMTLVIPPLRDRTEDIEPLALRFLVESNEANHRDVRGIEPEAMVLLQSYRWPGNVRELRNAIERAVVIARSEVIRAHDLPTRVREAGGVARGVQQRVETPTLINPEIDGAVSSRPGHERSLKASMRHYEKQFILAKLRATGWNQTEAAKQLGMPLRTLVHKIKVLGLKRGP